jgi:uncharacterized lipoprotein YmbA
MRASSWRSSLKKPSLWLLPLLLMACQSSPTELYVLSSQTAPEGGAVSQAQLVDVANRRLPRSRDPVKPVGTLGIAVTVPEYLDRSDIVVRTGANELKPDSRAQWGESLSIDAARVVGEDLETLLPSANVVILPSRARRSVDYAIDINLVRFENDAAGSSVLAGEWTISASDGRELASGRFRRREPIAKAGFSEMAAAMSRNLAAVSADLAGALKQLSPSLQKAQVVQRNEIRR